MWHLKRQDAAVGLCPFCPSLSHVECFVMCWPKNTQYPFPLIYKRFCSIPSPLSLFREHKLWGNLYVCFEMRRRYSRRISGHRFSPSEGEKGINLGHVGNSAYEWGEGRGASYLSWWFCLIPSESGISHFSFGKVKQLGKPIHSKNPLAWGLNNRTILKETLIPQILPSRL